ncbi:zinc ribbon domain-containing protein [Micromonospora sp. NPDC005305]|uniref:zinc ribbon domain-containing protein n=1 Tax=Micromonospora sp. NPDC005305 TaxID=3156875 RepID=UPI0033A8591C
MTKVACPFCYQRIDGAALWFQCLGRGDADRDGCSRRVDERRRRLAGFNAAVLPTFAPPRNQRLRPVRLAWCPDCGGRTGVRACPQCHTPLPPNFGHSSSPMIAMFGGKGTGKSVYLTVLARELRSSELRRRFGADIRMTGDRHGGQESSSTWLTQNVELMFTEHRLPDPTPPNRERRGEPLVFEWRGERRRWGRRTSYRTSYLSFHDTAGEDVGTLSGAYDLAYIGAADGLILLLDPFMLPEARERLRLPPSAIRSTEETMAVVDRLTQSLRASTGVGGGDRISKPIAVAFAKMDAFFDLLGRDHPLRQEPRPVPGYDERLGRATHEQVAALLRSWRGDDIEQHLRQNYRTFRYFCVSALGAPPDYDNALVEPGGVRPYRVDEPLLWLLSLNRFGVVPRQD